MLFVRAGHIAGVEMLTGLSDEDAIVKAHLLFSERKPSRFGTAPGSS